MTKTTFLRLFTAGILASLTVFASACDSCRQRAQSPDEQLTGLRITVKDAAGTPVLSRVAVLQAQEGQAYPRKITEAWVQAVTDGTFVDVSPGNYIVRAQGTGDSFMESAVTVKEKRQTEVTLGFATLVLDGEQVTEAGRVRVWQKREGGGEQIVVTRLVRPGERPSLALAAGSYELGWLPPGPTDEDANFKRFGGEFKLEPGGVHRATVEP